MTRGAVESGFEDYLSMFIEETYAAFDVGAVLRGSSSGGSKAVSKLLKNSRPVERHVVRPKLREYRRTVVRQFEPLLAYADSDDSFETHADAVLNRDPYWDALRSDVRGERREEIRTRLLERQQALGDAVAPVVAADSDEFWTAVREAYDRERAETLVEEQFVFTPPLAEYRDAFAFRLEIDPGDVLGGLARALPSLDVEFTDEALRAMQQAETQVVPDAKSELDSVYDGRTSKASSTSDSS